MSNIYFSTISKGRKVRLVLKNTHRYVNFYGKLTRQCVTKTGHSFTKINLKYNKIKKLLLSKGHQLNSAVYYLNNKHLPNYFFDYLKISQASIMLVGATKINFFEDPFLHAKTRKVF
jgi:hypothetical protein